MMTIPLSKLIVTVKNNYSPMKRKASLLKALEITFFTAAIYFLSTYPLRDVFAVFTVTDVRPGAALNPFLSLCFGPFASLGCSIATFIADYLSGYPIKVLFQGFPLQFIYGFVPYIIWKRITKGDDHSYRINSTKKYLIFTLIALTYGLLSGVGVAYIVYSNYGANFFETIAFVFMNNFTFTMLLGFPLMILANIVISGSDKTNFRKPGINEKIIMYSSFIEFIGIAIIVFGFYSLNINNNLEVYNIWNKIFIYSVIYVNIIVLITIIMLKTIESRTIKQN